MFDVVAQQTDILSSPTAYIPALLTLLAINGFVLWRRYRSRRELLARVAELEELSNAGSALLAAELDFTALCDLIVHESNKVLDTQTFQLGFFEGNYYHIQSWMINGVQYEPRIFDLSDNGGFVGWVREHKKSLLIHDFLAEEDLPARPRYVSDTPPRSAIFIPLMSKDEVLGILAAQSQEIGRFNEKHARQLTILANQAAAAIANSRLFAQERSRAAQVALIGTITHQVNELEDLEEIFERVVDLTQETFNFYQINIFVRHATERQLLLRASSERELLNYPIQFSYDEGVVGAAVSLQKTIIVNNAREDTRFKIQLGIPIAEKSWSDVNAVMVSPLVVNKNVWGVIEVLSNQVNVFTEQEQEVLETLAAGIAIAIQKAQQLNQQRIQGWLTTARLQVAEAIGRSVDLDEMLESIINLLPLLLGVTEAGILLWDEEFQVYRPAAILGVDSATAEHFYQTTLPMGTWGALDAVHVGHMRMVSEQRPPWSSERGAVTPVTLIPLNLQGEIVGTLYLREPQNFTQPESPSAELESFMPSAMYKRRTELIEDIAQQTAQAIERAQLRRAQQEEAWVNTALLQVADAVNSLIDLQEILDTIVRFVPMLVGVESCVVLFWDEEQELFYPGPSYGISEMGWGILGTLQMSRDELRSLSTLQNISPDATLNTVDHYKLNLPHWLKQVMGARDACAIPLRAQGRFVGAMLAGLSVDDQQFSGRRLNILFGIAQQAATAVVNNQLYAEAAERDKLEQELDVARKIQSSLIPYGSPNIPRVSVASYWEAARQVSGDFYDFIPLKDGRWAIVIADVADKGVPAAIFMAVSRTILRAVANSRSDPAEMLQRTNELIMSDSDSDLFVTIFLAIWDPQTWQLSYASGGHNPPIVFRPDGSDTFLQARGMALGVIEEAQFQSKQIQLTPNDVVLLYTDGITEAINEDFDEFGLERLRLAVNGGRQKDAATIITNITDAVRDHAGNMSQFDDITMVVLKCAAA